MAFLRLDSVPFTKSGILRCGSVRFSDIGNPTVRFGAVIYHTVRFDAVFRNRKCDDAVRCGFQMWTPAGRFGYILCPRVWFGGVFRYRKPTVRCGFQHGKTPTVRCDAFNRTKPHWTDRKKRTVKNPEKYTWSVRYIILYWKICNCSSISSRGRNDRHSSTQNVIMYTLDECYFNRRLCLQLFLETVY